MIRFLGIVCLLFCCVSVFGQEDKVAIKGQDQQIVEIVNLDSTNAVVEYILNGKSYIRSIRSFDKITYDGVDLNLDYWNEREADSSEVLTERVIKKSNPFSYGKFAISTNLTSLLGSTFRYSAAFFYDNAWFSIEPEYWLHDRFSIKVPILIGLDASLPNEPKFVRTSSSSWEYWTEYDYETNEYLPPVIHERVQSYGTTLEGGHDRNLQFQIGLNPKLFLTQNKRMMPYIGQAIHFAFLNMYQTDYYTTYTEVTQTSGYKYYEFLYEEQFMSNTQTIGFRYEGMFGMNFNLTSGLNFSTEVGYSNKNNAVNREVDRVFYRLEETSDFEMVKTSEYGARQKYRYGLNGRLFARVHLVYRFGGVRNQMD